ncbi:helix-turn-helix transcriptional regulator [Eubacteriales bacterium OttesenSCG-928-M02]|nr:helix-turn-helix transcriptional regulator [Eubacteriales bacterium OttesenSCG-928-M02]
MRDNRITTKEVMVDDSGITYTLSIISGKYKMTIMFWLWRCSIIRYNELKRCIGTISHKTLSMALKELEADGVVHREEYPQIPPKVEYSLTKRGESLIPIINAMCQWGGANRPTDENTKKKDIQVLP